MSIFLGICQTYIAKVTKNFCPSQIPDVILSIIFKNRYLAPVLGNQGQLVRELVPHFMEMSP